MVKGISKRVIVVKTPISSMFEQAIFILGDDALSTPSVDAENILREACAVADDYVRSHCGHRPRFSKQKIITAISCATSALLLAAFAYNFLL